jgi:hypothetical protein
MNKNISGYINNHIFKDNKEVIWVYLPGEKVPGENFDPYRNVGFIEVFQNPIPVSALIKQMSGNSLVAKEIGLVAIGAIEILINEKDLSLVEKAVKLQYKQKFYTVYNEALGSKVVIAKRPFNFYKVICYLQGNA